MIIIQKSNMIIERCMKILDRIGKTYKNMHPRVQNNYDKRERYKCRHLPDVFEFGKLEIIIV